ncbi:MAG: hypothetical protein AAGL98_12755, partial [Planctomycetota bacterium]
MIGDEILSMWHRHLAGDLPKGTSIFLGLMADHRQDAGATLVSSVPRPNYFCGPGPVGYTNPGTIRNLGGGRVPDQGLQ